MVVKKAHYNHYRFAGIETPKLLCINDVNYQGIGRLAEDSVLESAPQSLHSIVERAIDNYSECLMYSIFLSFDEATSVLNSIKDSERFEILAVQSDKLISVFGEKDFLESDLEFIGVDIDADGVFPIKEELFASNVIGELPKAFEEGVLKLNKFGIYNTKEDAKDFVQKYIAIQDEVGLELIELTEVELVSLYRPCL